MYVHIRGWRGIKERSSSIFLSEIRATIEKKN